MDARILELERPRLFRALLRLTRNEEDAADATQSAMLRAFRSRREFGGRASAYTWLFSIAINVVRDQANAAARQRALTSHLLRELHGRTRYNCTGSAHVGDIEKIDLCLDLYLAVQKLPPETRRCLVLHEIEGLSYDRIAQDMELTVEAVRGRLARGRVQLRAALLAIQEDRIDH
jgi:RNA polymerase sigma-70 factor, ECF subfamily